MRQTLILLALLALLAPALPAWAADVSPGQPVKGAVLPAVTAAWTSATALDTTLSLLLTGYTTVSVSFNPSGSITGGTLNFEVSDDAGTTWYPVVGARPSSPTTLDTTYALNGAAKQNWQASTSGFTNFRVRLNPAITGSGTANIRLQASASPPIALRQSGSLTGGGASTQVAFWTGGTALGGDSDLVWDSASNALTLSGSSGSGVLIGSAGAGKSLKLEASASTSGIGAVWIQPNLLTVTSSTAFLQVSNPSLIVAGGSLHLSAFTVGYNTPGSSTDTWGVSVDNPGTNEMFSFEPVINESPSGTSRNLGAWEGFYYAPGWAATGGGATNTVPLSTAFRDDASTSLGAGTAINVTSHTAFWSTTSFNGGTVTNRRGLHYYDNNGTSTVTNSNAVDCEDQTVGTEAACVRSLIAAGTGKWAFLGTGTAKSALTGGLRLGDTTAPTEKLEVAGNAIVTGALFGGGGGAHLTLRSNSDATNPGNVFVQDNIGTTTNSFAFLTLKAPSLVMGAGRVFGVSIGYDLRTSAEDTWGVSANSIAYHDMFAINQHIDERPSGTSRDIGSWEGYNYAPGFQSTGAGATVTVEASHAFADGVSSNLVAGTAVNITEHTAVFSSPTLNGGTVTDRRGLWYLDNNPSGSTIANSNAVDCADQTVSTEAACVRSVIASGTGKWGVYLTGTANNLLGGTVYGSEASSGNLTLGSTTHATKGYIATDSQLSLWPDSPTSGASQDFLVFIPTYTLAATALLQRVIRIAPTITMGVGVNSFTNNLLVGSPTINTASSGTATVNSSLFQATPIVNFNTTVAAASNLRILQDGAIYRSAVAAGTLTNIRSVLAGPALQASTGNSITVTNFTNYEGGASIGSLSPNDGTATATNFRNFWARNPTVFSPASIGTLYGLYVDDLTGGGANYSIYSVGTTASMVHAGSARFGDTTAPRTQLDVRGGVASMNTATQADVSFTIPTLQYVDAQTRRYLSGTTRATLQGTARLRIRDEGQNITGTIDPGSIGISSGEFRIAARRQRIMGQARITIKGNGFLRIIS